MTIITGVTDPNPSPTRIAQAIIDADKNFDDNVHTPTAGVGLAVNLDHRSFGGSEDGGGA